MTNIDVKNTSPFSQVDNISSQPELKQILKQLIAFDYRGKDLINIIVEFKNNLTIDSDSEELKGKIIFQMKKLYNKPEDYKFLGQAEYLIERIVPEWIAHIHIHSEVEMEEENKTLILNELMEDIGIKINTIYLLNSSPEKRSAIIKVLENAVREVYIGEKGMDEEISKLRTEIGDIFCENEQESLYMNLMNIAMTIIANIQNRSLKYIN